MPVFSMDETVVNNNPTPDCGYSPDVPDGFKLSTYSYDLPPELIAQRPERRRDDSRLLRLDRNSGRTSHYWFRDLPSLLRPSDLLVMNETRVVPAALVGHKTTGGRVELLVLGPVGERGRTDPEEVAVRTCLVRSSKPLRSGTTVSIGHGPMLFVEKTTEPGRALIRFPVQERSFIDFLERYGQPPLPPYIKPDSRNNRRDRERYQTVYARVDGSVAAPTAGLHFTESLLVELKKLGMRTARVLLHVGPGTFTPVREHDIRLHPMESEAYELSEGAAQELEAARRENRRIVAVGTTTVRALESAALQGGRFRAGAGKTRLFIFPGYSFQAVDGLLTNFHLPGSTLLMLVCAFAGIENVLRGYGVAVGMRYRFYSYGDACLIL